MSETSPSASAPAETAAASATPAPITVPPVVASAPAGPVPATIAELAAAIPDKAFCTDAALEGLTLVQAMSKFIARQASAQPAKPAVVASAPAADPVETGSRPSGGADQPIAMSKTNEYLEACRKGANPLTLGNEMFAGMNTGPVPAKERPKVFTSAEAQHGPR